MEKRMNKQELLKLIETLKIDKQEFWVLSSGALTLREIYPDAGDLDIAVTNKGLGQLKERYQLVQKENGWYKVNDKIECVCDGKIEDLKYRPEWILGIQVQNINEYLNYLHGSDRKKDKDRISLVEKYISEKERNKNMIKNIVFDIGNVILKGSPKDCLLNIDIPNKDKLFIEKKIFNSKLSELDLGYHTMLDYYNEIKKDIPTNLIDVSKNILFNSFKYRAFKQDIINLLEKLYNKGYKIYILSDNNLETYNYIKENINNSYISGWCISAMYHETKKNKKLFPIFFNEFNVLPEESFFIDDKLINIESAKGYGMNGFVLDWKNNQFKDLENKLKEINVL